MDFDLEGEALAKNSIDAHSLSELISIRPEMHSTQKNSNMGKIIGVCPFQWK